MDLDLGFIELLLQIITFPIALAQLLFNSVMDFLAFEVLDLGAYLPIQL